MKEKLIIQNFGPIKSVELELSRFNVLIGEQATGKSTVAKVLAMCRYFSYIIKNDSIEQPFENGLSSWGLSEAIQNNTYVYYECKHYSFTINRITIKERGRDQLDQTSFEFDFPIFSSELKSKSKEFSNLLDEFEKIKPKGEEYYSLLLDWLPTSFFTNDVKAVMDNPFYIRTERGLQSIFSLGKNSIPNLSDSLFIHLANLDAIARQFRSETEIEPLNIVYKNENGKGLTKKKQTNDFFSLQNGASGYQSAIPIVLAVKYYNEIKKRNKTFIIEEPELNIFPLAQYKLMQFLAENVMCVGNSVLLTTHSPYILTSLNNLMYAYQVGNKEKDKTKKIIDKKYWVDPNDVSAYMMLPDGTCENIMNSEEGMIKSEKIDEISRKLNAEFDSLQDIELRIKN